MKRAVMTFLQVIIVALGIVVFAALFWEPHLEGVNANATTLSQIYFDDSFLAYIYFSFITVFVGLYQAFKLLGYIGQGGAYSPQSVHALRTIKYCAFSFAGLIFAAVAFIMIFNRGQDDIEGGVAMGSAIFAVSLIIGATAGMFERIVAKRILIQ